MENDLQCFAVLGAVVLVLPVGAHEEQQVVSPEFAFVGHGLVLLPSLVIHGIQADAGLQIHQAKVKT